MLNYTGGMKMKYRIKTEAEFIEEFGNNWRSAEIADFPKEMDHLLGSEVDENIEHQIDGWWIRKNMIKEIPEQTVTEKVTMTEEQWRVVLINVFYCDEIEANKKLSALKNQGYVNKSELEILVEEAEEMYK